MKEYSFNKKDIWKKYLQIKKEYLNQKYRINKINSTKGNVTIQEENYLTQLFDSKEMYKQILYPDYFLFLLDKEEIEYQITDYNNNKEEINSLKHLEIPKINIESFNYTALNLKRNEYFELLYDFYRDIDLEFFRLFEKAYKNRKDIFFVRNNKTPEFFVSPVENKAYISFTDFNNLDSLSSLSHESAHYIGYKYIDDYSRFCNRSFVELETTFFQLLSSQYFSKLLNIEIDGIINEYDYLRAIKVDAEELLFKSKIIEMCENLNLQYIPMKHIYQLCKNNYGCGIIETNRLFKSAPHELLNYSFPLIVTMELFYLYEKDKDHCLYTLKKLIKGDNGSNYLSLLEANNIVLGEHSDNYSKTLIRRFNESNFNKNKF